MTIHLAVGFLLVAAAQDVVHHGPGFDTVVDHVPPADTTTLAAAFADGIVTLTWAGAGDDGMNGTPSGYWIVASTDPMFPIDRSGDLVFYSDGPPPEPAGSELSMAVPGLDPDTLYHFSVGTNDDDGNSSGHSNAASVRTAGPGNDPPPGPGLPPAAPAADGRGSDSANPCGNGAAGGPGVGRVVVVLLLPFMTRRI